MRRFGEFIAWIIGWDLILEFAVGAAVVAKGWSSYLGRCSDSAVASPTSDGLSSTGAHC